MANPASETRALTEIDKWVFEVGRKAIKPEPFLTVSEWADEFRLLSQVSSAEPGQWRTSRTPYLKEIMDALSPSSPWERVVFMKGAQIGAPLWIETEIPTPTGWIKMKDIIPGKYVFNELGKPCLVTGVSEIFLNQDCYKITFSDGAEVICDSRHLWTIWDEKKYEHRKKTTKRTSEIKESFKIGRKKNRNRYAIEVAGPLQTESIILPVPPYTLGAWLGDGNSFSNRITTHKNDAEEMAEKIKREFVRVEITGKCSKGNAVEIVLDPKDKNSKYCKRGHDKSITGIRKGRCRVCSNQSSMFSQYGKEKDPITEPETVFSKMRSVGVVPEKHIPDLYFRASYQDRIELLKGLMDTDGHITKNGRLSFYTVSETLANNVFDLIITLGFKPTMRIKPPAKHKTGTIVSRKNIFEIGFMAYSNSPCFALKRKLIRMKPTEGNRTTETFRRRIVNIERVESVPVRCISVNSESHLFLCSRWMIPTHNTECGMNFIGYIIDKAPGPLLHVMPTVDIAKEQSKTRLDVMIYDSPTLREKVSEPRSRDGGNTLMMKEFPGGFWATTGANSPASLRSKPIRFLFLDEVDAFPGDVGGEGDPVNLAVTRTRTFSRRKIFMASTPTVSGRSRIDAAYQNSDQRRFYVPCPHCGGFQVLKWVRVKWDQGRPEAAWYECEHCDQKIYNHEKTFMLSRGEWRSEVKGYSGKVVGYHLSSLYSPVGWFSWGEAATMFVEAKKNPELLKVFVNTVLGECWVQQGESPEWEQLFYRREGWEIGVVPMGGLFLTAGVDVQKDRLEVMVRAWGREKENWVVDYRVFPGDTSNLQDGCWSALDSILSEGFEHESGQTLHIRCLAIDTGFNTSTVYSWSRKYPVDRVMPVKGQQSLAVMVAQPKAVDVLVDGKKKSRALKLWNVGVSIIKSELYGWLKFQKPGAGEAFPPGYTHIPDFPEEFFKGLCAETLVIKDVKGRKTFEWVQIFSRNEPLDTAVYSRAAASLMQIDKFTGQHWDRIEDAVLGEARRKNRDEQQPPAQTQKPQPRKTGTLSRGVRL